MAPPSPARLLRVLVSSAPSTRGARPSPFPVLSSRAGASVLWIGGSSSQSRTRPCTDCRSGFSRRVPILSDNSES